MAFTIKWTEGHVEMLDQRLLPEEEIYRKYSRYEETAEAIRNMVIRGAPAIGIAAAMGAALGASEIDTEDFEEFWERFEKVCETLAGTRPTAVNLFWALERMKSLVREHRDAGPSEIKELLKEEAKKVLAEDIEINRRIGKVGSEVLEDGDAVLTHCNAGALATGGYGTALGVIRAAVEQGKRISVFADETRPFLQGARLTTWELMKDGIPVTLITDNMAGYFMAGRKIQKVVVGADRIAANGDTANKIGTYTVAVLADYHNVPFYIAAPMSTIDYSLSDGGMIPIEERDVREVDHIAGCRIAPEGIEIRNPAFDVTPASLIRGIITDKGIALPPLKTNLEKLTTDQ